MVLFIDDRPIRFISVSKKKPISHDEDFDLILDARLEALKLENFKGHTCVININLDQMEKLINQLHVKKNLQFSSLYILVKDTKEYKAKICSLYSVVEAAGGVVVNQEKHVLWIYRLGKWDLPKGKLEKSEKFKLLKTDKNNPEYEAWFLRYRPGDKKLAQIQSNSSSSKKTKSKSKSKSKSRSRSKSSTSKKSKKVKKTKQTRKR